MIVGNMNKIELGIQKKLISFNDDKTEIFYLHHNNKKRNYTNPEEQVQAETYVSLILDYNYRPKQIGLYVSVTMGASKKEADIVIYHDDEQTQPHILIECKKQEVSEAEFNQAVEQAYSYAYAMPNDVKYVWVTSGIKNEYFEVDKTKNTRLNMANIPARGISFVANYHFAYEPKLAENAGNLSDLVKVEESELTRRFKQAHDALWAGGQLNPSEAFDELDKLIFCKIWDERQYRKPGEPYDFQIISIDKTTIENYDRLNNEQLKAQITAKENEALSARIYKLYEAGRAKDPEVFRDNIRLSPARMRTVVDYLQAVNLSETDLDSKGRAFETFMDSFFRGNFGQYFTPRPIVKFITEILPITNESLVLDTSCGSGGFLLYALDKVRKEAERIYPDFAKLVKQNERYYKFWHDFAEKKLFGIEINEQISRAAKMNMIIHDDGHTNVISSDGLLSESEIQKNTKNEGFKYNTFDFIITNPPFGATVKKVEKDYLKNYDLAQKEPDWLDVKGRTQSDERDSQSTEVLFIEQCYNFLKAGGYLAIVLPDGVLTNSSLQYVRDWIEEKYRIVAVISMPQTAFAATGAGVKSSVLVLRKHSQSASDKIHSTKLTLQTEIKKAHNYLSVIDKWEKEKAKRIKDLDAYTNIEGFEKLVDIKQTSGYKEWKEAINAEYAEKISDLKEQLQDEYQQQKQKKLPDYPIFMALAEDIGYDATGKQTNNNELLLIGEELKRFIQNLEHGDEDFFHLAPR
jgi:type I restriction enzyme M protein